MLKKMIVYIILTVLSLLTFFWGLATWAAFFPDESYHHCEAGQDEMSPEAGLLVTAAHLLLFCVVWYMTIRSKKNEDPKAALQ